MTEHAPRREITRSRFRFKLEARREKCFYVWEVFLPLMLIVFISWGVFWIDPELVAAQISLGAISMLNLIEHQFAVRPLLPRISYLTRADKFALASALLVFLALVEAILTAWPIIAEKHIWPEPWTEVRAGPYPAVFAAIVLFVLVL